MTTMASVHADVPGDWLQITVARAGHGSAGECALAPQTHEARTVAIGFTIAPERQGRGYAREAVILLLRYLFGQLGKHRVTASYDPRNPPWVRVLEAVGMRRNHGDWFVTSGGRYVMRAALGLRRPRSPSEDETSSAGSRRSARP